MAPSVHIQDLPPIRPSKLNKPDNSPINTNFPTFPIDTHFDCSPEDPVSSQTASMLHSSSPISQPQIESLFDTLRPVDPPFLMGSWAPGYVNVQSAGAQRTNDMLRGMGWAGKDFHSEEDVDAVMLWGEGGRETGGRKARLREIKSRGTVTTAMIYDDAPIIDTFKRVTDDMVLGMMDNKDERYPRNYMFFLERLK